MSAFYRENFELTFEHGLSHEDIMMMLPWERDVYISMVAQRIQEREKERKNA